jgi:hypothetical protein
VVTDLAAVLAAPPTFRSPRICAHLPDGGVNQAGVPGWVCGEGRAEAGDSPEHRADWLVNREAMAPPVTATV